MSKFADHVKLGDHELVVDGNEFPWLVLRDVEVTETGHPEAPWLVHVEILPIAADDDSHGKLDVTCPASRKKPVVIGDKPFPWFISRDGYQVHNSGHVPTVKLAFYAKQLEDVRSDKKTA